MRARTVTIHNYKSICEAIEPCSLELDDRVTILIGANESGKTNILEAIHKFSTGAFGPEDIPYASPSAESSLEELSGLPMVSIVFEMGAEDHLVLDELHPQLRERTSVTLQRTFDGQLRVTDPLIDPTETLDDLLQQLSHAVESFAGEFPRHAGRYRRQGATATPTRSATTRTTVLREAVGALGTSSELDAIRQAYQKARRVKAAIDRWESPLKTIDAEVLQPLESVMQVFGRLLKYRDPTYISEAFEQVAPDVEMVTAEPQLWLDGKYEVVELLEANVPESLVSIKRLLEVAGLDLAATRELSDSRQKDRLQSASERATGALKGLWHEELDVEVIFDWSSSKGNAELTVDIRSSGHRGSPRGRSLGFRWFLEFYLVYAAGLAGDRPTLLLFEEPGVHLNPRAQEDLKRLMRDDVAARGQVLYTTHLPGMYDTMNPERGRAVRKTRTDRSVTVIETSHGRGQQLITWRVAMDALGISSPEIRLHPLNLLVEGPADWLYLLTFTRLLSAEGKRFENLMNGMIHIRPCGGTSGLKQILPAFLQDDIKSVVLVDDDQSGRDFVRWTISNLGLPNEQIPKVFTLADFDAVRKHLGAGEHDIEDLLDPSLFRQLVNATVDGPNIKTAQLDSRHRMGKVAEDFLKGHGVKLEKDAVAWTFMRWHQEGKLQVMDETKEMFAAVLEGVSEALGEQEKVALRSDLRPKEPAPRKARATRPH